jgi:hypothetical protein
MIGPGNYPEKPFNIENYDFIPNFYYIEKLLSSLK